MNLFFTLVLSIGMATQLFAQTTPAETSSPLPPGPLLKPVPDFTQWIITQRGVVSRQVEQSQSQNGQSQDNSGNAAASKQIAATTIVGQRTGDIRHIVMTYGNGTKMDFWKKGGLQVVMSTGWKTPVVGVASLDDLFGDAGWISAANFEGMKKVGGKDCMVFRDTILPPGMLRASGAPKSRSATPLKDLPENFVPPPPDTEPDPETLKVKALAYIEEERRLPIAMQLGEEVTTYKFDPVTPEELLTLPSEVQSSLATYQQEQRGMARKPVRP